MGTKITALPPVITPIGTDELPISQDIGGGSRNTYKATLDQLKDYVKTAGGGTGTITSIGITSTDGSVGVFNSPITSSGTISLTISSVGLDKLDDGGATGGEVLTYNASTNEWEPGYGGSSGIIPNILVGNGGTTYTLTDYTNDTASNYLVFVGGVAQRPTTDFTISGSSIIFGSTVPTGVQILVYSVINIASLNVDSTPIGTVSWFAASAAPTSYLECSGGVVAISEYLDLYNVIGKKYNTGGEGASNFRLPDLRGEFIRGWDHGRGADVDRVFGDSQQGSVMVTHVGQTAGGAMAIGGFNFDSAEAYTTPNVQSAGTLTNYSGNTLVGSRPRNVALLPCIKARKTVTGNVNTLNFIEKPAGPTNGQVLTYNGSTSTWVASSYINNSFFRNTLIGEVTASPDGTVASYGSQIKGRYEIKYERGVIYQNVGLDKAGSFNVTFLVGSDSITSDYIKIGEPYIFDHSGGNITCYAYDSNYTDNSGTGFALSLWKLAPIFCNPQI